MMEMMLIFMLLGGGGTQTGDLLDYTPTQAYWEFREMPVVDADTMSAVLNDDDASPTDRLMAIRTLGEIASGDDAKPADKANALNLLEPLVQSNEPFVGQYAKRSIEWINGVEPPARAALPAEAYDQDLALLPLGATHVGQMKMTNGVNPIDLAALFPDVRVEGESLRDAMTQEMVPGILEVLDKIGNARADLVTAGTTLHDEESFAFYLVVRGEYDRTALQIMLEDELGDDDDASFYSVGETEVVSVAGHDPIAMLMPSNEMFILLFSETRGVKLPIDEIAKKLQQPDRKPRFEIDVMEQVDAIDRKQADIWVAMKITKLMTEDRQANEIFGAYDAARVSATRDTEGVLDVKWFAEGSNEAATARSVDALEALMQEGITEMTEEKQHMPAEMQVFVDPIIEMLESMKFEQQGTNMSGGMKADPKVGLAMPMMMFGMSSRHHHPDFAVEEAPF